MAQVILWAAILFGYLLGYVWTFRRIAGQIAWHCCQAQRERYPSTYGRVRAPDGNQWAGGICAGLVLAIVWPASLPVAHGISRSRTGGSFFYMPSNERERLYAGRIKELEREAGIR